MDRLGLTDRAGEDAGEMVASRGQRGEGVLAQGSPHVAILEEMASPEDLQRRADGWLSELEETQRPMQQIASLGVLSSVARAWPIVGWGGSALAAWLEDRFHQLETILWQIQEDPALEAFVDWRRADDLTFDCHTIYEQGVDYYAELKERLASEAWGEADVSNLVIAHSGESALPAMTMSSSTTTAANTTAAATPVLIGAMSIIASTQHSTATTISTTSTALLSPCAPGSDNNYNNTNNNNDTVGDNNNNNNNNNNNMDVVASATGLSLSPLLLPPLLYSFFRSSGADWGEGRVDPLNGLIGKLGGGVGEQGVGWWREGVG
ncbi:hypothetical protein CBR_g50179 [Chara braunii]|uniref:Uncharacterized protein n=1 Tax=Chara braunii TaxID=69332 RepID=A0A388M6D2_CHABU|nr:hypothetical protein CBR_g50179 [Chara braunii]|eukprot:GBG90086.1 hypothetical protein CBR_g50179 [Chara braunii]